MAGQANEAALLHRRLPRSCSGYVPATCSMHENFCSFSRRLLLLYSWLAHDARHLHAWPHGEQECCAEHQPDLAALSAAVISSRPNTSRSSCTPPDWLATRLITKPRTSAMHSSALPRSCGPAAGHHRIHARVINLGSHCCILLNGCAEAGHGHRCPLGRDLARPLHMCTGDRAAMRLCPCALAAYLPSCWKWVLGV